MRLLLSRLASAVIALAALSAPAFAQRGGMDVPEHATRPVVMELFSSQGCGNCCGRGRAAAAAPAAEPGAASWLPKWAGLG